MQVDGVSRSQNPCTGLQVKIAVRVCGMISEYGQAQWLITRDVSDGKLEYIMKDERMRNPAAER